MKKISAVFLSLMLLASCSGQINGTVFLDNNRNGIPDTSEKTLANVALQISKDDVAVASVTTDSKGFFSLPSKGTGYYCVSVADPDLNSYLTDQVSAGSLSSANLAPSPLVTGAMPNLTTVPAAKNVPTSAESATTTAVTTAKPVCGNSLRETNGTVTEECDDGNTASNDGCSSTCKKEGSASPPPPPPPDSTASGKVCQNLSGMGMAVHVPFQFNATANISPLPPVKETHKPGDVFEVLVPVPIGCNLIPLLVSDKFTVIENPNISVDSNLGEIRFNKNITERSFKIQLKVKDDIPLGTTPISFVVRALCNGSSVSVLSSGIVQTGQSTFDLASYEIALQSLPTIEVRQSLLADCALGAVLNWKISVLNNGDKSYSNVMLIVPKPQNTTASAVDNRCDILGDEFHCRLGDVASHADISPFIFGIKFPDSVEEAATFLFTPSLSSLDFADKVTAEEGKCTLSKPPSQTGGN